ncbi:MAG: O-antigen ligase family protein [Candidatus Marinimicrobia bacterium]|nr:O-antigen ligase family protein [Candidatus Neomarinimicrobiota bacterium]MBT3896006.1 O-antigen ligase family protein [Candidatus Neomarinimicrobiota bacterium]MBT4852957.1 O-antigen ligase family protein [Candidatus Neomarinimicrobiota bacterium]MBT6215496.1 O-antigen ligase family protein [Candidatus Neomarinimicrobiota bacterium]
MPDLNLQRLIFLPLSFSWFLFIIFVADARKRLILLIYNNRKVIMLTILYFSINFVSVLISPEFRMSLFASLNDFIYHLFLMIIALSIFNKPAQFKRIFIVLLSSGIFVSILGFLEYIKGSNLFIGLIPVSTEFIEQALSSKSREYYRVQSTFGNPLGFAQYLILILPISFYALRKYQSNFIKILGYLFLFIGSINILLTRARSPIIVILVIVSIIIYKKYMKNINKIMSLAKAKLYVSILPVIISALIFSLILIFSMFKGRSDLETGSNMVRVLQLQKGIPKIIESPLIGYGKGMAPEIIKVGRYSSNRYTVDNYYLSVAVDTGLPSLIIFILIFIIFIRKSKTYTKIRYLESEMQTLYWSVLAFMISIGASSLKQSFPLVFLMFAMILAIQEYNRLIPERRS